VDLTRETAATRTAYGLDDKKTVGLVPGCCCRGGWWSATCGFVQVYSGGGPLITQWDAL
jgi:hypothetical protein